MDKDRANRIYDILVNFGAAPENYRSNFVYHHAETKSGCDEYRFGGKLGFGGKYLSNENCVTCYSEDETPSVIELMNTINNELSKHKRYIW